MIEDIKYYVEWNGSPKDTDPRWVREYGINFDDEESAREWIIQAKSFRDQDGRIAKVMTHTEILPVL